MTVEQLRRLWKEQPFHPFNIHLADGRTIPVKHQEFLMPSPTGRTAAIYQPDGSCNIVDLLLVTDLEIGVNGKSAGGSKKRRR